MRKSKGNSNLYEFIRVLIIDQIVAFIIAYILYFSGEASDFKRIFLITLVFSNCIGTSIFFTFYLFELTKYYKRIENKISNYIFHILLIFLGMLFGTEIALILLKYVFHLFNVNLISKGHLILLSMNFLITATVTVFILFYFRLKSNLEEKIMENQRLQNFQTQTKLMALQSKINPHFLFNTLNSILDLVYTSPEKVETIVLNLSDIYRKIFSFPENSMINMQDEIELIRNYLEIEKIRMGKRMDYKISVDEKLLTYKIPPLLIEPVIENSVIHGISPKKEGGIIKIDIYIQNKKVKIIISDNGIGIKTKYFSPGFGLYSVQERLKLIYKNKAIFNIEKLKQEGTKVIMELPYEN